MDSLKVYAIGAVNRLIGRCVSVVPGKLGPANIQPSISEDLHMNKLLAALIVAAFATSGAIASDKKAAPAAAPAASGAKAEAKKDEKKAEAKKEEKKAEAKK